MVRSFAFATMLCLMLGCAARAPAAQTLTYSWDYARVQTSLDGKPLGNPQDCYTPEVQLASPTHFGTVHLTGGRHILGFQAVGKNEASRGYLKGIDYIFVVRATPGAQAP